MISDKLNAFKQHLLLVNRSSEESVNQYEKQINSFLTEINKDIDNIELKDVENYISKKIERNKWQPRTQNTFISLLSSFLDFNNQLDLKKQINIIRVKKISKGIPVHIKPKKIKEMSNQQLKKDSSLNERDNLMLKTLFATGLRQAELINLKTTDFDNKIEDQLIKIKGKGNKIRRVLFPSWLIKDIFEFIKTSHKDNNENLLFTTKNANRLSSSDVYRAIREKADFLGLKISPHKLRSSYAREYLESGGRIEVLQELLGHASANTTRIYTDIPEKDLKKIKPKEI